jgi:Uma2 family endonuclease
MQSAARSKWPRMTVREFAAHPAMRGPAELVRGEVRVMTPASGRHGLIVGAIYSALDSFVEANGLGVCFPDNTGFNLPGLPDTVRSPDVAFVSNARIPPEGIGAGFPRVAPDLVVEVLSPDETPARLEEKLRDYFAAGTQLVWVVDPDQRIVTVRPRDGEFRSLGAAEDLDGGSVLPGFAMPVAKVFAKLARG